jgi:predicted nucleic acid-binding protein
MNGNNFFVDTNFLIYLLNGNPVINPYLGNNYFISEITEMEMLGVKKISPATLKIRQALLDNCYLINFNSEIKKIAVGIKQKVQIKLPDAIVAASAIHIGLPIITADKGFRKIPGLNLVAIVI